MYLFIQWFLSTQRSSNQLCIAFIFTFSSKAVQLPILKHQPIMHLTAHYILFDPRMSAKAKNQGYGPNVYAANVMK